NISQYTYSEGGIDYNCGLVAALGYIVSMKAPVDTNKFGNPTPNLGPDQSLCGVTSITLDSKIAPDGIKTFTWKRNGTVVQAASKTANKYTVTQAGTYECVLDSAGKWTTSDEIVITSTLPDVDLGNDITLCSKSSDTLDLKVTGSGITYSWTKNGTTLAGKTARTLVVFDAGTYRGTISATGCPSKYDEVIVTSNLVKVKHDTICAAGRVNLQVLSSGGPFDWYETATGGTKLSTGTTYSPTISSTKTFYVQDASSISVTGGPSAPTHGLTSGQNAGNVGVNFTAKVPFTITQITVIPFVYSCNSGDKVKIVVNLKNSAGTSIGTYTSGEVACTGVQSGTPFNTQYTLIFNPAINIPAAGNYTLETTSGGNTPVWFEAGANFTTMDVADVIDFTSDTRTDKPNSFPGLLAWKIQAGNSCVRTPVFAVIDPNANCGDTQSPTTPGAITVGTITQNTIAISWGASTDNVGVTGYEIYVNNTLFSTVTTTSTTLTGLDCNTSYAIKIRAKDAAGNLSTFNTEITRSTTSTSAPTVTSPVTYCQGATATALTATGTALKWYTTATGGTGSATAPTPSTTVVGNTSYYVSQTVNNCESPRATITVTINPLPSKPTVTSPVTYQQGATATPLSATGTNLKWYTTATGGISSATAPTPSTATVGNTNYYVSQTVNNCESERSVIEVRVITATLTQTISLKTGWNLISLYVVPADNSVASVFAGVASQIVSIKDMNNFYIPTLPTHLNGLKTIETGKAYFVEASGTANLQITGTAAPSTSISLKAGWNLLGYPKSTSTQITTQLTGIWTQFQTIKNFDGFYQKNGTMNSLSTMDPGKGYMIQVNNNCTLNY
ncbi:MAG: hypothetical protein SNJ71_03525, partial [Bacteroidales bacterium]